MEQERAKQIYVATLVNACLGTFVEKIDHGCDVIELETKRLTSMVRFTCRHCKNQIQVLLSSTVVILSWALVIRTGMTNRTLLLWHA